MSKIMTHPMLDPVEDAAYLKALRSIAEVDDAGLRRAVAELRRDPHGDIIARVMGINGPSATRYSCGVCNAFGVWTIEEFIPAFGPAEASNPFWVVNAYHDVPKLWMKEGERHVGAMADAKYVRCLATYRACGWMGTAPSANSTIYDDEQETVV